MQNTKYIFWIVLIIISSYFLGLVSSILTPFIASMLIAYFLDPLTIKLERLGIKRNWTVSIIVGSFFSLLTVGLFQLAPVLFEQIQQFVQALPKYENYVTTTVLVKVDNYLSTINPQLAGELKEHVSSFSTKFFEYIVVIISSIFNSSLAILNIIALIFFTPILVFYLLRDWKSVEKNLKKLLPRNKKSLILEQFRQIDEVLSAYIRGQIMVCLILSIFYVISLSILGLNYSLLIGIIVGFLTIIPYLGLLLGGAICVVVALLQFNEPYYVYAALSIFLVGHLIESCIITPKIVGEKIGLHPVWIIFAIMAGGELFGFWGVFFAIPIAAIIGVIFRSLVRIYLSSHLYKH